MGSSTLPSLHLPTFPLYVTHYLLLESLNMPSKVGFSGTIVSLVSMLKRVVGLLAFPPAAAISSTVCPRRIAGQIGKYNIPL